MDSTSTHEESSKIQNQNEEEESNYYPSPLSRKTLRVSNQKSKENLILESSLKNKNRESLPIKPTISNFNFKIVLIGNVAVGKSSIIKRYITNEFDKSYLCTVGTELSKKGILIEENKKVNLFIWDTCGQERFRTVTRQYYRDAQAILLVFDLTNEKSFNDLNSWFEEAVNYINNIKCLFFLIGNKSDDTENICVKKEKIKSFLRRNQKVKKYFEVSAFNGLNIFFAFEEISRHLLDIFSGEEININMKEYKKNLKLENRKNIDKKKEKNCC